MDLKMIEDLVPYYQRKIVINPDRFGDSKRMKIILKVMLFCGMAMS
jgi:hypothetical protein